MELKHSGVAHDENPPGRGSGRYEWGSGENPGQHQFNFLSEVKRLRNKGISDSEIAKALLGEKAKSNDLKAMISISVKRERQENVQKALKLLDECHGNVSEVARRMGKNESSIRSLLDPAIAERTDKYQKTAEIIKEAVDNKGMIDVSSGVELYLGVTDNTKKVAISMLQNEGYVKSYVKIPQLGTHNETTITVLAPPGTTYSEIQKNKNNIQQIEAFSPDKGVEWWTPESPSSVDSSRIMIRYAEEGGADRDGTIELKRGVEELSLGPSLYSQVRIAVDGTHYMKGMALYGDAFPDGKDIIFNTNKHIGTPMNEVLKELKSDPDNPFGATIKPGGQRYYVNSDGETKLSPINKIADEGDWSLWSKRLASQFLSKQPLNLINQQLELTVLGQREELDKIKSLTNPIVRKKILEDFAENADANASDLSAVGFKNQAFQVILPIPDLKDNEVYAPNYPDGEVVALIRYPHAGLFEIPILKVNNRSKAAKKVMNNAADAVGINQTTAQRLSGADFDGDTALVIPIGSTNLPIKSIPQLEGLKNFDPKEIYKLPENVPGIKPQTKQNEMGRVTNLITDMTVGGATPSEIAKAVRHSMVVIDSEKHHLDYKQSAIDNDISALKEKYQGGARKGASTILSKASSEIYIDKRKEVTDVNKMTQQEKKDYLAGKKIYHTDERSNTKEKITRMSYVDNAIDLVGNKNDPKEMAYANFANSLKALANEARKEARQTKPIQMNQSAKEVYAKEVESLNAKLRNALMNTPKERQAQIIGNAIVSEKFKSNPDMDYEHKQRERARALMEARAIVGAKKDRINITDKEWEAIQAGAISSAKLMQILNNTDQDRVRELATPRNRAVVSDSMIRLAKAMAATGNYSNSDIADRLGISNSYVSEILNEK